MNVEGIDIQQGVIDAAVRSFPPDRSFTLRDLAGALIRGGVPHRAADRCADRTLQKLRRAGTHSFSGGKWRRSQSRG